jgi:hypothetical protein
LGGCVGSSNNLERRMKNEERRRGGWRTSFYQCKYLWRGIEKW